MKSFWDCVECFWLNFMLMKVVVCFLGVWKCGWSELVFLFFFDIVWFFCRKVWGYIVCWLLGCYFVFFGKCLVFGYISWFFFCICWFGNRLYWDCYIELIYFLGLDWVVLFGEYVLVNVVFCEFDCWVRLFYCCLLVWRIVIFDYVLL